MLTRSKWKTLLRVPPEEPPSSVTYCRCSRLFTRTMRGFTKDNAKRASADSTSSAAGSGTQDSPENIGVQVKFHQASSAPSEREWLKFLAECFARRLDRTVFITTGRLTGEQRREAGEANIVLSREGKRLRG